MKKLGLDFPVQCGSFTVQCGSCCGSRRLRSAVLLGKPGPAVPQARAGSRCLWTLGVQALASPHSGRFADVSLTLRVHTAPPFGFLHTQGQLECGTFRTGFSLLGVMRPRLESVHTTPVHQKACLESRDKWPSPKLRSKSKPYKLHKSQTIPSN